MSDLAVVLGLVLGTCLAVGVVGAALLYLVRRRSLRYQLVIATLLPVLAVVATVLINVRLMFLSAHDSRVILVALLGSLVLAVFGAWLVLRQVVRASRQVGAELHQLVDGSAGVAGDGPVLPAELASVREELARTRDKLAEARDRERAAEQARRDMVGFLAHDLRTPLAGLRALAEGLEDGVVTDVPRAAARLRSAVQRMAALIDDLFALSRLAEPDPAKPHLPVALAELLADATEEAGAAAAARGVRLVLDLPDDDRLAVHGAADDLARAASNLVDNAISYTAPGGTVRVAAGRTGTGAVQLSVTDECGGIPAEDLPRLFELGWRGTAARSAGAGSGLGLVITQKVVAGHGGTLRVDQVPGGCRFAVQLPRG